MVGECVSEQKIREAVRARETTDTQICNATQRNVGVLVAGCWYSSEGEEKAAHDEEKKRVAMADSDSQLLATLLASSRRSRRPCHAYVGVSSCAGLERA